MPSNQIIPAILATTEEEYHQKLEKISQVPELAEGWAQIDLMDGQFVANKTISPYVIAKYPTHLKKEAHLMVEKPEEWVKPLVEAKVERIIFPIEVGSTEQIINKIKEAGLETGLSISPKTEVEKLKPFVDTIDVVLVMTVEPGFGGQTLIPATLNKIREIASWDGKIIIEADGGINETNARQVVAAGAKNLIIGEHLINGDIVQNLENIWETLFFKP